MGRCGRCWREWTPPTRGTRLSARVDVSSSRSVVGGQACAYGDAGRQDRHQHPQVMVETPDGKRKRSYTVRAIPYQDPQQEAERLKAVHEARVKNRSQGLSAQSTDSREGKFW